MEKCVPDLGFELQNFRFTHWRITSELLRYMSRTVATWSKASALAPLLRDARWFEFPGGRNFIMEFRSVYGTGAHPASWGIWEAKIGSESWFEGQL